MSCFYLTYAQQASKQCGASTQSALFCQSAHFLSRHFLRVHCWMQTLAMLDGDWKLVYTSNSELLAILALSKLPFVTIGDITQHVDSGSNTVENKVQISVPLSRTAFSTRASFEVRSPKRLQVRFEKGVVQTPQLLSDIEVPNSLSVMGQNIDLSQVRGLLQPAAEGLSGIISQVRSSRVAAARAGVLPWTLSITS